MNDFEITLEKIIIRTRPIKNGNRSIYLENVKNYLKKAISSDCKL